MASRPRSAATWDAEYRSGRWDYLTGLEQAPRYAVLSAWCQRLCPTPRVLDLGCGEALLLEALRGKGEFSYYGIDFAPTAIERARRRIVKPDREVVECISVEVFDPTAAAPNLAIFNESLNCCAEPFVILDRYLKAVGDGFVLLSITGYDAMLAATIEERCAELLLSGITIENHNADKTWHLMALDPRSRHGSTID